MISILITILVVLAILVILWWGYTQIAPKLPEPFRIVMVIIVVIVAILMLLWIVGMISPGSLGGLKLH